MCGIAGILDPQQSTTKYELAGLASLMAAPLHHRGPDDAGVWVDASAGVALGHRRLAVIDLSNAAAQPLTSSCGNWTVAYNGELYGFQAVREALRAAGRRFRGHSDTEVLVESLAEWGLRTTLERCNGMFAFAAWDHRRRLLHLARDRLGEKPLYYGMAGPHVVFGSELKAIRAHPQFVARVDRRAVAAFLRWSFVPAPHSIFEGVYKLPPGTVVSLGAGMHGSLPSPRPYWSAPEVIRAGVDAPLDADDRHLTDALEDLLRVAVAERMVADVPLGAFLSGGVDSSLVTALMQAQSSRPVRTFSVDVGDYELAEGRHAAAVARHLGTEHTEIHLSHEDALEVIPELPTVYDEPFGDPSQIPTLLIARAARAHVTVGMSGDGGDELFGGYNRYTLGATAWRRLRPWPRAMRAALGGMIAAVPAPAYDHVLRIGAAAVPGHLRLARAGDKMHKLAGLMGAGDEADLYLRAVSQWTDPARVVGTAEVAPLGSGMSALDDPILTFMARDALVVLPDNMLVKVDRATMAASMEARVPILDHRVFAFAWRLPPAMRVRDGRGKWILRQVLRRYVPDTLVDRPKTGFDPPIDRWLRDPLREWAETLLSPTSLTRHGLIDPAPVRKAWAAHLVGGRNHDYRLWAVLMLSAWLEQLDAQPAARLPEHGCATRRRP